ncbi:MAG: DUF4055 domain-containing protein [Acidimicrobiia bacterium]|nr:DUF4055 domain-containing protein [Acidimicrobiia bacterium]
MVDKWTRVRDVIDGSDAVKKKGTKYLPRLSGQSDAEYAAYKQRALFFSVSGRSLSALTGLVTRRIPVIEASDEMRKYFEDSSHKSMSFHELFIDLTDEVLMQGRIFALVDWPEAGGQAYVVTYAAESVINWKFDNDTGELLWAVTMETIYDEVLGDQFEEQAKTRYRHLHLVDGVYTVDVYEVASNTTASVSATMGAGSSSLLPVGQYVPRVNGNTLDYIPGIFVNPYGISGRIVKPPILDIVDVNLSQYITSADLEHGRHYTALPTPVVSGVNADTTLKIGSQTAWAIPEKAKAYYLEFLGQGLASLERAMAEKTSQMAQFSTRLMDTTTRGSEAADTVRLRHSSEAATLSGVAKSVESALNWLYNVMSAYEQAGDVTIIVNKDFLDSKITHSELKALTDSYVAGAIDQETYFYNLYRGELVPPDKTTFVTADVNNGDQDAE